MEILDDLRPAHWLKRLCGESRHQVGFIRRNAWNGLALQSLPDPEWRRLVQRDLQDPYYEVRSAIFATLKTQCTRGGFQPDAQMVRELREQLKREHNFEVLCAGLQALPCFTEGEKLMDDSRRYLQHSNWRVRDAFLNFLTLCLQAGKIGPGTVRAMMSDMNLLSEYFMPTFSLQERRSKLEKLLAQSVERATP